MGYTLDSKKDSRGDEASFQNLYTQNKEAIDAYVRAHSGGKDPREAAFKAITGLDWPAGRGVNSKGAMTADRTVKSVLGKYVAPIAAGALTAGFALPALAGGGTVAGYGIPSGLTAASEGMSIAAPTAFGLGGTAAATTAATAGRSAWDRLRGFVSPVAGAGGSALTSVSDAQANNRGVQLEADIARAQLDQQAERDTNSANISRSQDDRAGQKSAWDMLNHAAYVKDAPANLNTTNLSTYSRPIAGPSAEARQGATSLTEQTRDDLMSGRFRTNGGAPLDMPQRVGTGVTVLQPGALERWGGALGTGLTAWDRLKQLRDMTAPATNPRPTSQPY